VTSLVQQTFGEAAADYAASAVHARRPSLARLIELANPKPSWRCSISPTAPALAFAPLVARVTAGRQQ
jgi:anti-sigma factor RsiW